MAIFFEDTKIRIDVIQVDPGLRYRAILLFKKAVSPNESIYEEAGSQIKAFEIAGRWMHKHSDIMKRPWIP